MTLPTILTEEEIQQITKTSRPTTQIKRLRFMGLTVIPRHDNTALVSRDHFLKATDGLPDNEPALQGDEPDWGAL